MNFEEELKSVLKEGGVLIGVKRTKKSLLTGKSKLVIIANSAPSQMRDDLSRCASLSKTPMYNFSGSAKDLGYVCGKPFPISCLSVIDEKGSKILETTK